MDTWSSLDRATQFRIALEIATKRGKQLARAHSNVISVGAGFRSQDRIGVLTQEVCLRYLVRKKWKRRRPDGVPPQVGSVALVGGRRVRVSVPTDVSEFIGGSPHSPLNITDGITSRNEGQLVDYGSSCCLVRNAAIPGERYLLSCYHVFSPSLSDAPSSSLDCLGPTGVDLGQLLEIANPDAPSTGLDAALVLLEDANVDSLPNWSQVPAARATDFDISQLTEGGQLSVYGRRVAPAVGGRQAVTRTGPLPASFHSYFPDALPFDYRATAGRFLSIACTIQYVCDVLPGDSGSAVLDANGMLVGMHFYGQGDTGFAMAAPRLFDPGVFSIALDL